jgi:heme-degrading monooxygenase HmoA
MIVRQWHGWTRKEDADAYEELFQKEGNRKVQGRKGAYLLRRNAGDEIEFIVQTLYESLDAIRAHREEDYEVAGLMPGADKLLLRYDETYVQGPFRIVELFF